MSLFPDFDVRLLFQLSAGLGLAIGLLFLVLAKVAPRAHALPLWALGIFALGAGNAAHALRGIVPDWVSIVLANALILAALVALHAGSVRLVSDKPARRLDIAGWSIVALSCLLLYWLTHVSPDLGKRVVVVCLATAMLAARTAMRLSAYTQGRGSSFPADVLAGLWWFIVIIVLVTALATAVHGERSQDLFQTGPQLMTLFHVRPLLLILVSAFALWTQFHAMHRQDASLLSAKRTRISQSRAVFDKVCDRAVAGDAPLAVALIDMDNFHRLGHRHGQAAAEAVLQWVEQIVCSQLRATDVPGIYGNDQFAILLPGTDRQGAVALMEDIRQRVHGSRYLQGEKSLPTTVSVGLACRDERRASTKALIAAAKVALYQARALGRNHVVVAPEGSAALYPHAPRERDPGIKKPGL